MLFKLIAIAVMVAACIAVQGCTVGVERPQAIGSPNMNEVAHTSKEIGQFLLSGNGGTIGDLLAKLRTHLKEPFNEKGMESATLTYLTGEQWAELSFDKDFRSWRLGVQFYRFPAEKGNKVIAKIRTVGSQSGGFYDPDLLNPLLKDIHEALLAAQNSS